MDVRLRHWRSPEIRGIDRGGIAFRAAVLVVWRARGTVRALWDRAGHEARLGAVVEAAVCRVVSSAAPDPDGVRPPRDPEALAEELTATVAAECRAVGLDVYAVRPLRVEFVPGTSFRS
ncbi:hypothetical protein [Streptomyces sp. NBC_00091]|uniref:hypothetical protein n=1 Tax=Streptomyces sp. NBC_00091 TaxID=2975648 RepID=UPI0022544FF7|nr:hypothetical protein [Streptomyces sp. NBC_00091]MCX5377373.1 hypothetical protein [Streptomyces sp. NBC_00091]